MTNEPTIPLASEPGAGSPSPSPASADAEADDHALAEAVADLLTAEDRVAARQLLRGGPTEDARTRREAVGWDVWPPHR